MYGDKQHGLGDISWGYRHVPRGEIVEDSSSGGRGVLTHFSLNKIEY